MTVVFDRSPRGLVVVSGEDATSFLQSLVSQDLDAIGDRSSAPSLLLTPQGKLDVAFRITRVGEEWWLDTDGDYGARLAESLTRYRIRVKADIVDRTDATGMLSFVGSEAPEAEGLVLLPTTWGVDALGDRDTVGRVAATVDLSDDFERFRIEHAIPRLGVDIDDKTIPQEAFLDRDSVSFTKGCFLGQELVARIDSRGHVNRYLRRIDLGTEAVPPPGATVVVDGRDVGAITSAEPVEGEVRVVALAMVRREVEPPAEATVRWDGAEAPATVLA